MIKLRYILILAFLVLFAQPSPAPLIYRPGQGWEVEGVDAVEETSKQQLEKGEHYEKAVWFFYNLFSVCF